MRPENIACGRNVIEVSDNPLNTLLDMWLLESAYEQILISNLGNRSDPVSTGFLSIGHLSKEDWSASGLQVILVETTDVALVE